MTKKVFWKCKESCVKKCVIAVNDKDGKLDGEFEIEMFPGRCPFAVKDVQVSFHV